MTLDEMISDIDYVVNKNQLATLELGDESTKQLLHWLEDYKRLKSASSWIPCSEKMPDDNVDVLVYDYGILIARYNIYDKYDIGWMEKFECYPLTNVTHWMPLPEPPQRKDDTHDYD